MKQLELLQTSLSHSIENLINADASVDKLLRHLCDLKKTRITRDYDGEKYRAGRVVRDKASRCGVNEDAIVTFYGVSSYIRSYCRPDSFAWDTDEGLSDIINLGVMLVRDPKEILNSGAKLTDEERKVLKRLDECIDKYGNHYEEIRELNRKLRGLKHGYGIAIECNYSFTIEDILSDDFLDKGIEIEEY